MVNKDSKIIEREYVIPLRGKIRNVPRYKKTPKAVKTVMEFIARHMKVTDRNLKNVRLDTLLNESLWFRGIRNPIHKIKVRAVKEGEIVRVYAVDLPKRLSFKKIRLDKKNEEISKKKSESKAKEIIKSKVSEKIEEGKAKVEEKLADKNKDGVKDVVKEKEKKTAVVEEAKKDSKEKAKVIKKTTPVKAEVKDKNKEAGKK